MRAILLIFFILSGFISMAQSKPADIDVTMRLSAGYDRISLKITSQSAAIIDYKLQILDADKKIVKHIELPKGAHELESNILIQDLAAGEYTCVLLQGKTELFRNTYYKDAAKAPAAGHRS